MSIRDVIVAIDEQISTLQHVKQLLRGEDGFPPKEQRGPAARFTNIAKASGSTGQPARRVMSDAGKARIAAAQKKRWSDRATSLSDDKTNVKIASLSSTTTKLVRNKAFKKRGSTNKALTQKPSPAKKTEADGSSTASEMAPA